MGEVSVLKIRIKFSKQGAMKFIGHLDLMRYFQKALRRAEIPVAFTEGFSPHMIMSFAAPLGVGLTSNGEYMDIEVHGSMSSKEAVLRLNRVMVEGIQMISYRQIPEEKASKAMSLVTAADYIVTFQEGYVPEGFWEKEVPAFFASDTIVILKKSKKGQSEVDIKPLIYKMEAGDGKIFMRLATGSSNNLKPELVMEAFARYCGLTLSPFAIQVNRLEVYAEKGISLEALGEEIGE